MRQPLGVEPQTTLPATQQAQAEYKEKNKGQDSVTTKPLTTLKVDPAINREFQPPPPPAIKVEPARKRPANLLWAGGALAALGIIIGIGESAGLIPGGVITGLAVAAMGALFFLLGFTSLPNVPDAPPPMSTIGRLAGIFYEPTNVFRNLRAHPRWLAAILIMGCLNGAYITAFYQRLTPERIVNFTMDKFAEGAIKLPPEQLELARQRELANARSPIFQAGTAVKTVVGTFFGMALIGLLCLLGVLAFGGRMHFSQAYSVVAYAAFPVVIIQKVISFIILFVKSPEDIHPLIGQDTLVTDNMGILFKSAEHPVLYVAASAIGIVSFYKLWLTAKGLHEGGYKVSSSAGWSVAITLWILLLLFGMALAALLPSFLS